MIESQRRKPIQIFSDTPTSKTDLHILLLTLNQFLVKGKKDGTQVLKRIDISNSHRYTVLDFVVEPERETPVVMDEEVVVVGGGPAGIGAALASARTGADTLLIEAFGSLGGMGTLGLMSIGGSSFGPEWAKGITKEVYDRVREIGGLIDYQEKWSKGTTSNPLAHFAHWEDYSLHIFDPEALKITANEMMEESGVKLLFHTLFVDTIVEDNHIKAILVENVSGRQAIRGRIFVDATGTGDVVARSGAPYTEPRDAIGAPMPMSLMYKMSGVNFGKLLEYQKKDPELTKLIAKAKEKGELPHYRTKKTVKDMKGHYDALYSGHPHLEMSPLIHPGELLCWGGPTPHEWRLNGTKVQDLTRAETNIRKQIWSEVNFLKKYVPGFENAFLSAIAPYMGVREKRHPIGEYVLTYDDVKNGREFDDVVLKMQPSPGITIMRTGQKIVSFDIPYRCLLPKRIDNLLLAGDNVSADHGAFLHMRSVQKCMAKGEVAGTAAALSAKNKVKPKDLGYRALRRQLVKQGVLAD